MTAGEPPDGHLVFQGGVSLTEKMLARVWW
jgi:hypothetical protein